MPTSAEALQLATMGAQTALAHLSTLVSVGVAAMTPQLGTAFEQYAPQLRRFLVYRVRDPELAEDLLQVVFLEALEHLPTYEDRGYPLSAWLYSIARSRSIDALKQQRRRPTVPLEAWRVSDDTPEATVTGVVDTLVLVQALADLTADQRRVIVLRYLGGRSIAQAAEHLGTTEGAVKALQHRALGRLRRYLTATNTL